MLKLYSGVHPYKASLWKSIAVQYGEITTTKNCVDKKFLILLFEWF